MEMMSRQIAAAVFATAAWIGISWATLAAAQTARPTITRAVDLIDAPGAILQVNAPAAFKVKESATAKRIAREGVLVRIFSLGPRQQIPTPISQADNCDIYISVPHKMVLDEAGALKFETIAVLDKDWLNLSNSLRTVESGHYFFVFEQGSSEIASSEQFRIRTADAARYFETGFRVTVEAGGTTISADSLKSQYQEREARLGQLKVEIDRNTRPAPCFSYKPVTINADAGPWMKGGELRACAGGAAPATPLS